MGFQNFQDAVGGIPLIGLIFVGSPIAVGLKILVLVALIFVGWKVIQTLLNWLSSKQQEEEPKYLTRTSLLPPTSRPPSEDAESLAALVKQGQLEAAGDMCVNLGDFTQALGYFEEVGAWSKAADAALKLNQPAFAALCFERSGDVRRAAQLYFEAGKHIDAERVAFENNDKEILVRAATLRANQGDMLRAAKLYYRADLIGDAERCCFEIPDDGPRLAAQLYLKAYDKAAAIDPTAVQTRHFAQRAADLLERCGQPQAAEAIREQAGVETGGGSISHPPEPTGNRSSSSDIRGSSSDIRGSSSDIRGSNSDIRGSSSDIEGSSRGSSSDIEGSSSDIRGSSSDIRGSNSDIEGSSSEGSGGIRISGAVISEDSKDSISPIEFSDTDFSEGPAAPSPSLANELAIDSPFLSADELLKPSTEEETKLESVSKSGSKPSAKSKISKRDIENRYETRFGSEAIKRYELLDELGRGGMAEVYQARDRALGRIVALKFLSSSLIGDKTAMRLFAREARAAAALNHPGIVTIYDIGVLDNRPYISMEFIDGEDLRSILSSTGPLSVAKALNLAINIGRALDYAHENNVLHRDIKPANVIIATDETVKLLDFGVAKAMQGGKGAASILAGTPQYMAPEQLAQGELDGRSDLFALGVLLYRALTNKRPFKGIQRQAEVKPPSSHAPWVPTIIDHVIVKAIALNPDDRYQRANEFADALVTTLEAAEDLDDGPTLREDD